VQHAGRPGKPLLPAAGKLAGKLVAAAGEPHALDDRIDPSAWVRHFIYVGHEIEILKHREVLIEAEFLGHVADLTANLVGLADDIEAETSPASAIGREQAAQHADGGGFAAAVGAEKAADLAFGNLQAEPIDHSMRAEALAQIVHVDDKRASGAAFAHGIDHGGGDPLGRTATGWPGLISGACADGGLASTV
jgi:hypothetical protein